MPKTTALLVLPGLIAALAAQEPAAAPATASAADALLREALAKTAELPGGTFKTVEVQDLAMMRRFAAQMPASDVEITGQWQRGLRAVTVNDEHKVVLHAGRLLVQDGKNWALRRDTLLNGQRVPFVLDPELLFTVLRDVPAAKLAVRNEERVKAGEAEHVVLGITLDGSHAIDAALSGALPVSGGFTMMGPMAARLELPAPELTVDLAFTVDPATKLVQRVRAKVYRVERMPDNVRIQVAGGEGGEEETEEDAEPAKPDAKLEYKKGLPVRKLDKSLSVIDYDVKFTDHGQPAKPDLDDRAARLLKWTR